MSPELYALATSRFEIPSALLTDYLAGEPQIVSHEHLVLLCCIAYLVKRGFGFSNADLAEIMHVSEAKIRELLRQLEAVEMVSFEQFED